MSLSYLFDPNKQFQAPNGLNNVNGFLRIFLNGTDDYALTYKDFTGTFNKRDIPLDNNGRCVVIVDEDYTYRIEVYDREGSILWTQYPVRPTNVSINYGEYNTYNMSADVYGTPDEINVTNEENPTTGFKKFFISLSNTVKNTISALVDDVSTLFTNLSEEITRAQNAESGLNTAIGNEVTRATNKENELGTAIANEVTRATAAEKAAKTEVKAGDNIEVSKTTGADGHDIYTVNGVESVPNVNITSPNSTIDVHSSTDIQTNTKTFTLDVKQKPLSVAWLESSLVEYNGSNHTFTAKRFTLINNGQQNPQGDKITLTDSKLYLKAGTYHVDSRVLINWTGAPQNRVIMIDGIPFDLSYNHSETLCNTSVIAVSSTVLQYFSVTGDESITGLSVSINAIAIYAIEQVMENVVHGLTEVHHDETLSGTGTEDDPLSVEGGGTEYTAGNGINISSGTISAKLGRGLGFNSQGQIQTLLHDAGALTDAASINVTNNATQQLTSAQAALTLNVNCEAGEVPNFAVEISASAAITLTLTKTVNNVATTLYPSEAGGTSLESGKYYQVTCVGNCWTLAEFVYTNAQRSAEPLAKGAPYIDNLSPDFEELSR